MNQSCRRFGASAAATARTPSIKFLGKRLSIKPIETIKKTVISNVVTPVPAVKIDQKVVKPVVKVGTGVDFTSLTDKAWFGRPKLTVNEILAIESGGATEFNPPVSAPPKKK